jgi:hypothetical protein
LRISLENYRFAELRQSHRFWLSIEYRVGIFLVILFLVGLFVGVNIPQNPGGAGKFEAHH